MTRKPDPDKEGWESLVEESSEGSLSPGPELERQVWARLGSDLKPAGLKDMARTIPFADLPKVFDDFINAKVTGRIVVDLNP